MIPSVPFRLFVAAALFASACSSKPSSTASTSESTTSNASTATTSSAPPVAPAHAAPAGPAAPPDVAAPPADAVRTASGLASKVITPGTGTAHPSAESVVTVHYSGWTTDGEGFDSSVTRGQPATFPLNGVIPGWTEGLQLMVQGETRRFWIPVELAYRNQPGRPAGMLVFDVQLLSFETPPPPPPAPSDVATPPTGRACTAEGICSRVIRRGTGSTHPTAQDVVTVHYTGWLTTGEAFDSSVTRGEPVSFPLNRVIPGWRDGVQLMTVGEVRRLWIPEALAYQGRPGMPPGMLVFDVELISIAGQ